VHNQAEAELEALRSELQQQQQELSKRAEALAAAAKEGAAQVRPTTTAGSGCDFNIPTAAFYWGPSKSNTHQCGVCQLTQAVCYLSHALFVALGCLD
jgi:cell division FtsZ-interacting protein ZapD